jgi:hypothetical protein
MMALTCQGNVLVWGDNALGVSGMPSSYSGSSVPTLNPTLSGLTGGSSVGVELTTGSSAAAILVRGQAYGFGNNNLGQCGCGSTAQSVYVPTPVVQNGVAFTSIDAGGDTSDDGHTLALDASGNAYCWGDNLYSQCGSASPGIVTSATQVPGLPALTKALAGGQYSMFLDATGTVWTCGNNALGEVGNGTWNTQVTPVSILHGMTLVSAGAQQALAADGSTSPPPTTSVIKPANGATLSGTGAVLDATASGTFNLTKVEFHLTGGTLNDALIATAAPTFYGWLTKWDTTAVSNGTYSLQSVAYDAVGNSGRSAGVMITVSN